jgi:hypothetical protein
MVVDQKRAADGLIAILVEKIKNLVVENVSLAAAKKAKNAQNTLPAELLCLCVVSAVSGVRNQNVVKRGKLT